MSLCPLEICQGAILILSQRSVNLIFRSWVSLSLETTCYLYTLTLTVQAVKQFALWLGFLQVRAKQTSFGLILKPKLGVCLAHVTINLLVFFYSI